MKNILIASFDMEVGGVERSLINMLSDFDYNNNKVDLMLYRHKGDFMKLLPNKHNLLKEIPQYATYRKNIKEIFKDKMYTLGICRVLAYVNARLIGRIKGTKEISYYQMQFMWKYAMPFLPKIGKEYDVAISYLWPHYFIANKVMARKKIAWIHTDYSTIEVDIREDLKIWNKFDYIIAVSEECKNSFLRKYPSLINKLRVMENITAPDFIKSMAEEDVKDNIRDTEYFNIVSVGRLSYAKGIDNAVRALKLLNDKGLRNIKWNVVGYGGDEKIIRKLIKENNLEDRFILLGKKTNPYPYIKASDLYVQPSRYEGKAVTVTEAQILGKPVMITDYPTAKSQINDKIDGYITELSVDGIADGIERLYKDKELRNRLSSNCINSDYSNKYELENLYRLFV